VRGWRKWQVPEGRCNVWATKPALGADRHRGSAACVSGKTGRHAKQGGSYLETAERRLRNGQQMSKAGNGSVGAGAVKGVLGTLAAAKTHA
jgi:hypothetical protein